MTKPKNSCGIVGFFDILGYANFLENNDPEEAAQIVISTLLRLKSTLQTYHIKMFPEKNLKRVRSILKSIEFLVFSDTILLALPYPDDAPTETKNLSWVLFFADAILLYRHLFDLGLPVRGALAYGKYLIQETCFAGRNIIEAYKLAQQLDFAGVVLAESATSEVEQLETISNFSSFQNLVQKYRVPLKNAESAALLTLAPSLLQIPKEKLPTDLRQYIAKTFWQHNKDLPPKEIRKIENTELYFRFFRMKIPGLFREKTEG